MEKIIRLEPTKEEAEILIKAQSQVVNEGHTSIRCPRCESKLEYVWRENGESMRCTDQKCIAVHTRGI